MRLSQSTKLSLEAFLAGVKADTGIKFDSVNLWNHDNGELVNPSGYEGFKVMGSGPNNTYLKGETYVKGVTVEAVKYFKPVNSVSK